MSWKAWESVFWMVSGGFVVSEAVFVIAALAALIFASCVGTASQTCLAQASSLGLPLSPLLHPVSATASTAPPDSAAASFLFTRLVPSMALGHRNLHAVRRTPPTYHPIKAVLKPFEPCERRLTMRRCAHTQAGGRHV